MVWQGPRLGFVAESGRFVTMNAMSTISCFCALLPTFLVFSFLIPACFIFFVLLRLCNSSHLLLFILYSQQVRIIVRVISSFICILPHLGILFCYSFINGFFFSKFLFLGWRFFCCALVPGTLALDLPTWMLYVATCGFSLSQSVTIEFVSQGWIRKDTGGDVPPFPPDTATSNRQGQAPLRNNSEEASHDNPLST